ncbi:hypothetical protein [Yersinia kristensenii]|uniref:Uncharacterized protein n=1 Tax=Yersinia kristensenii TaxID=28152 RepID=A0A0T9L9X4_YERKR|nr:hypothetical protein [Yersinia kristensenii]CNE71693.1 Uncharacterised protein [Yersinia kristensenii]
MKSQRQFEAWINNKFKSPHLRKNADGSYVNTQMNGRWLIWQESRNNLVITIPAKLATFTQIRDEIIIFMEMQGIKVEIPNSSSAALEKTL